MKITHLMIAALVLAMVAPASARAAENIGVAAAVTNKVTGTVGTQKRSLARGDGVFQQEIIETASASTTQLLFRDETALTVGPNSRVVLDTFVYDPKTNTGKVILNATRGAFRFVTGSIDPRSYEIRTPSATIGVRGSIIEWAYDSAGNLVVYLTEGATEICVSPGNCVTLTQPGTYVTISPDGTINGPFTGAGTTLFVVNGVPFPLFGGGTTFTSLPGFPYSIRDLNTAADGSGSVATGKEDPM